MRVLYEGVEPDRAELIVVLIHGRGSSAESILSLSAAFADREEVCWLAPHASGGTWYPKSFLEPRAANEPHLTVSLESVRGLLEQFEPHRTLLGGFSQGACLASDLLLRTAVPRAGAWLFSGGLIGEDRELPEPDGDLKGTPVLISGSLSDPHIPAERMKRTAESLRKQGAEVDTLHYPQPSHTISDTELARAGLILDSALRKLRG